MNAVHLAIFPYGGDFVIERDMHDNKIVHFNVDECPPEIIKSSSVRAATEQIRDELQARGVTGVNFEPCRVSKTSQ